MIEVVSHPPNLSTWDPETQPFYLELYGETQPVVETRIDTVEPAGPTNLAPQRAEAMPVYEYSWTIGHSIDEHEYGDPRHFADLWERNSEPAAHIGLYFPLDGGWRVNEISSAVKYLRPLHNEAGLMSKMHQEAVAVSPALNDIGKIASFAGAPGFGVEVATDLVSAIARMQINNTPPVEGFEWHVRKVIRREGTEVLQGVRWTLPKKLFSELGGRLTGSIAVSFMPTHAQQNSVFTAKNIAFQTKSIRLHACVFGHQNKPTWAPGEHKFIHLRLKPTLSPKGLPRSESAL